MICQESCATSGSSSGAYQVSCSLLQGFSFSQCSSRTNRLTSGTFTLTLPQSSPNGSSAYFPSYQITFNGTVDGDDFGGPVSINCKLSDALSFQITSGSGLSALGASTGSITDCGGFECQVNGKDVACADVQAAMSAQSCN